MFIFRRPILGGTDSVVLMFTILSNFTPTIFAFLSFLLLLRMYAKFFSKLVYFNEN